MDIANTYSAAHEAKIAKLEARLAERVADADRLHAEYVALATESRFESDEAFAAYQAADAAWTEARHLVNRTQRALGRLFY